MEIQYKIGDMIQPNCSTRCTCQKGGFFTCETQTCLLDGPHCYKSGDPHYQSFDNHNYQFQGDCEYVLSQPCNGSDFVIIASNTAANSNVSETNKIRIIIPSKDLEIVLSRGGGGIITINGVLQVNNGDRVVHHSSGVEVVRTGGHPYVLLTIGWPLGIYWNGWGYVDVSVSSGWEGKLCGLCGNYNNDGNDDFMLPNGTLTTSANDFGSSWLYSKPYPECEVPPSPPPCPLNVMIAAQSRCNELLNSIFNVCKSVVDPTVYINNCILDYCQCSEEDRENCYCNSLSTYAADCASNGITIPNWRKFLCCKYRNIIIVNFILLFCSY